MFEVSLVFIKQYFNEKGYFNYANLQHVVQMFWAQISSMIRYKNCGEKGVAYTCWWLL